MTTSDTISISTTNSAHTTRVSAAFDNDAAGFT
jgi:hypothetical protein